MSAARNGRDKPWKIDYVGVGNEPWGCGGDMRAEYYADEYQKYALNIKTPRDNTPIEVASGAVRRRLRLDRSRHEECRQADGRAFAALLHAALRQFRRRRTRVRRCSSTKPTGSSTLKHTLQIDEMRQQTLGDHGQARSGRRRSALYVDEWGTWYDVEPGTNPGFLFQQNTLRDAVVAGLNLNVFHSHADRVRMTNIAQMINVLQAMVLTDKEKMLLTPTYHVFEMYKPFQNATLLPTELATPDYKLGRRCDPGGAASRRRAALMARWCCRWSIPIPTSRRASPRRSRGAAAKKMQRACSRTDAMNAHNTFDAPNAVQPAAFTGGKLKGDTWVFDLPAKSVVVATLN